MARTKSGRMITKDIENMTITEYMEYEAKMKRHPWGYAQSYSRSLGSTTLGRSKVVENKHHLDKLKTNAYFPSLPPCFKPAQPLTKNTHEPLDPNDYDLCAPNSHHEDEEVSFEKDVDEWLNAEMGKRMTGTSEIQGVSFVTEAKKGDSSETLSCQLPPKEINPGSFTLPCTIGNLNLYAMTDLGASVNVMPKSLLEHLKLADVTTMLLRKEFELLVAAQTDACAMLISFHVAPCVSALAGCDRMVNIRQGGDQPNIAAIIAEQLQNIIPQIVTQVTANVNNAQNANGGSGGTGQANNGLIDNSGYLENQKVNYASSSLANKALTWWKGQVQTRGRDAANGMTWNDFKALMREEFSLEHELEKLELELWNHKMVGGNHAAYTDRFQELARLVPHMVTPESSRIKRYIAGLAPEIQGMVKAVQQETIQTAVTRASILTEEDINCGTLFKENDKRKADDQGSKSSGSGRDNKRSKVVAGFAAAPPRKEYVDYPRCNKCNAHHPVGGDCKLCFNCQRPGHFAKYCREPKYVAPLNAVKGNQNQRVCYECGSPNHIKPTCPKLNRAPGQSGNQLAIEGNRNNRGGGNQVRGKAYNANMNANEAVQDPKVVTGTFSINDHFASVLFDFGADFSFISTEFANLLNMCPSIVRPGYVIEIADEKRVEVDRIFLDCKLELGNSLFSIDLIPLGHGSFDVIVGMDWLARNKAMIICHEKVVEIPVVGGEALRIHGE
ncbi:putative reverse transcriptase domain-containing protein [Tanacetum coccineum]